MSNWYGYDPTRVDTLRRHVRRAVDDLDAVRSSDPAAATALSAVRAARSDLVTGLLPLLERVRSSTAMTSALIPGLGPLMATVRRAAEPGDTRVWDRLNELSSIASTPNLPYSVAEVMWEEHHLLQTVAWHAETEAFSAPQCARARDALLDGADVAYVTDLLWGLDGFNRVVGPTGNRTADAILETQATVREHVGQAIATSRGSLQGLADYVVVEVGYGAQVGVGLAAIAIVSSSGRIFSGGSIGASTPGGTAAVRVGHITPPERDHSGEEVDQYVQGLALTASVTGGASVGVSLPLVPFRPLDDGRSSTEHGVGLGSGGDLSLAFVVGDSDLEVPGWAE